MKICYLCQDLGISVDGFKGASSHIRGFVGALRDLNHHVDILSPSNIPLPHFIQGIPHEDNPRLFRALRHVLNNASVEKVLEEYITQRRPDVIYERYSPFGVAGGIIAGQQKIPHILEVNAPLADQGKRYRNQALPDVIEYFEETAFIHPTYFVTLTEELKGWLVDRGIDSERILVRPCGVDDTLFTPFGPTKSYHGKIVIGFVGSLKPWHDIELLAEVFRELAKDPKYHLLVIGDGPMRKVIQTLSEELPDRVTMTGAIPQEEVVQHLRAVDIALAPYPNLDLFYFSPLKAFEYMAVGKAMIATRIGQLETLIEHGKTGWFVPAGIKKDLIEAIQHLADNPELREKLGNNAVREVQKNHTWKKRAQRFMEQLRDVAKVG